MNISTENDGIIKTKWNEESIKSGAFLIRKGFLIKGVSEVIEEWNKAETAREVLEMFLLKLTDLVSGKFFKNIWWNHQKIIIKKFYQIDLWYFFELMSVKSSQKNFFFQVWVGIFNNFGELHTNKSFYSCNCCSIIVS